jgi:lipoprotein-anchoring transpeptidase ErfK/SrfK
MNLGRSSLLAIAALLFQAGCASLGPRKNEPPKPPRPPVSEVPASARKSYWSAEAVEGNPWIVIVLGEQRAYFFKDQTVVGESKVSSGKKRFETPPGEYKVIQKDKNHVSNLYGKILDGEGAVVRSDADMSKDKVPEGGSFAGAKMPYFLRFHGGYGMHAGRVPSHPASHGCVRLPSSMAPHFFEHAPLGTPVSVIQSIPTDETGKRKKAPAKKAKFRWPWDKVAADPAARGSTDPQRTKQRTVDPSRRG